MEAKELIEAWRKSKRLEILHRDKRRDLGQQLAELLGHGQEIGKTKTYTVDSHKVTVNKTVYRQPDWDVLDPLFAANPDMHPPVKVKRELDPKGLKHYETEHPDYYRALCDGFSTKPGVPQITIKDVEIK